MYSLISRLDSRTLAAREAVTLVLSLGIAEAFYKFHSFTLECVAFIATWVALGGLAELATRRLSSGSESADSH